MSSPAEPVGSGQSYTINEVDGRVPNSLDDFNGDIHLLLIRNEQALHVVGNGTRQGNSVRFYQKDLALNNRDIRVWTVTAGDDYTFLAAPLAAF
jgi:hypothetical protein